MISFVATPIGNLKDITLRALETLREADVIFCEDTRHTVKLLNAYEIKKPLYACHKFNETEAAAKILERSRRGENVAIVSDAGTPVVSDPGNTSARFSARRASRIPLSPARARSWRRSCFPLCLPTGSRLSVFCPIRRARNGLCSKSTKIPI